ncbi:MAG: YchJ family protein [Candidatus Sericytochromatia bacterium]
MPDTELTCPCGSGRDYRLCCGPFHAGTAVPATAEELMRSRYSAYALVKPDYLFATQHPQTRPTNPESIKEWAESVSFEGLEVLKTSQGGPTDKIGKVEFRAVYRHRGQQQEMREISRFRRYQGRWVYYDGDFPD